jgi:hypothetical protein
VGTRPTHAADRCIPQLTCGEVRGAAAPRTAAFAGARMGQARPLPCCGVSPCRARRGSMVFQRIRSGSQDGRAFHLGAVVGVEGSRRRTRWPQRRSDISKHRSMSLQTSEWFGAIRRCRAAAGPMGEEPPHQRKRSRQRAQALAQRRRSRSRGFALLAGPARPNQPLRNSPRGRVRLTTDGYARSTVDYDPS